MKNLFLGSVVSGTALLVLGSLAGAADIEFAPPVFKAAPQPVPYMATGYVELYAGSSWTSDSASECSTAGFGCLFISTTDDGSVLGGAGRGNFWFLPNVSGQFDVQAEGSSHSLAVGDLGSPPVSEHFSTQSYLIAAHFNWRDPQTGLLGVFGGGGDVGGTGESEFNERHYVVGAEGQYYWNRATFYLQGGYDTSLSNLNEEVDNVHAWFVRGTARYFIDPNLLVEATGFYANGAIDWAESTGFITGLPTMPWDFNTVLADAKLEWKPASIPFSFFAKYQWSQTTYNALSVPSEGLTANNRVTDNRVLFGARLLFGESSLLSNDRHGATLDIIDPLGTAVSPLVFSSSPSGGL
jgi:hypothetical protein